MDLGFCQIPMLCLNGLIDPWKCFWRIASVKPWRLQAMSKPLPSWQTLLKQKLPLYKTHTFIQSCDFLWWSLLTHLAQMGSLSHSFDRCRLKVGTGLIKWTKIEDGHVFFDLSNVNLNGLCLDAEIHGQGDFHSFGASQAQSHQTPKLSHGHVVGEVGISFCGHPGEGVIDGMVHAVLGILGCERHIQRWDAQMIDENGII
mmetsp:Transcript_61090/g.74883  ORF Transcript_61090/g.74883 Transcript_61090/m.74883 type:complete len:201 (+) Transcript_61090:75-677(+)